MKQITVISGKGGTGKTTLVASLATLVKKAVLADADVDAADLHLLLKPQIQRREPFFASKMAVISGVMDARNARRSAASEPSWI